MHAHTVLVALLALSATAHARSHALPLLHESEDEMLAQPRYSYENVDDGDDIPTPVSEYMYEEDLEDNHRDYASRQTFPATHNDHLKDPANEAMDEGNLDSARDMARLSIMDRLLIALGHPFSETLPKAPTNDTLATVPTPINITAEPCPYKYKRCSSQTFFPSCDIPRHTDHTVWQQKFNLYFNLSADFDNKLDVINATLRLFKNNTLRHSVDKTLLIKVMYYNRSLTLKRSRTTEVAEAKVSNDYIGWVSLPVDKMVRRWKKSRNNHGLLVTVTDDIGFLWDAPALFVTMDCTSGLVPLPFEVQTDEEGQRYPALNVRQGILDEESPWPVEEAPVSPVPTPVPEDVTFSMQSDDPLQYDEEEYVDAVPTVPTYAQPHPEYAPEVAHAHGRAASSGPGHLMDQEMFHETVNQARLSASHGEHRHSSLNRFGHNGGSSHTHNANYVHSRHQGHAFTQEFGHQAAAVSYNALEDYHRVHSTTASPEAIHRIGFGERGHSGERRDHAHSTEEGRGHRQRGGNKERRLRKKSHQQHHRRPEERRAAL